MDAVIAEIASLSKAREQEVTLEKIRTATGVIGNVLQLLTLAVSICGLILLLHFHGVL